MNHINIWKKIWLFNFRTFFQKVFWSWLFVNLLSVPWSFTDKSKIIYTT